MRAFILGELTDPLLAVGLVPADVPDDFDLLTSGVIDSLGIVNMVVAIEDRYAVALDDLEADDLTNVGRLVQYVASKNGATG